MSVHDQGRLLYEITVLRRPEAEPSFGTSVSGVLRTRRAPEQTIIRLRNANTDQLHRLVRWLTDLRIDVSSIRRCQGKTAHRGNQGSVSLTPAPPSTSYEVGVFGRLGPA